MSIGYDTIDTVDYLTGLVLAGTIRELPHETAPTRIVHPRRSQVMVPGTRARVANLAAGGHQNQAHRDRCKGAAGVARCGRRLM